MTTTIARARHRAAGRPLTPLDDLASTAGACLATVGRRSAVVAAAGGLAVTMALPASASPAETASVPAVDVSALTSQARSALAVSPVVSVPADVTWSFAKPEIKVVANPKPPPPPPPAPEPEPEVERRSSAASRSSSRAAVPAQAAPAPAPAQSAAPPSVSGNAVLDIASRYVGVPYVYGGSTPSGFDCSGFTSYVYAQLGINLPRSSGAQRNVGTVVPRSEARPGDLIWSPGHVAIYAGGNTQIDAPRPGKSVQFRGIWQSNPTFIRVS